MKALRASYIARDVTLLDVFLGGSSSIGAFYRLANIAFGPCRDFH